MTPSLYAGAYAGGFSGAGAADDGTWNLAQPDSWTDFRELLADGTYFREAFSDSPELSETVTVYTFTDLRAPDSYRAATQAITFTVDPKKTTVLTCNFNGMRSDGSGTDRHGTHRDCQPEFRL